MSRPVPTRAVGARPLLGAALAACLAAGLTVPGPARADIYKFVDANGNIHLSDRPLGPGYVLIMRGDKRVKGASVRGRQMPVYTPENEQRFTDLISRIAREMRLDKALVHAIVRVESAFDPHAVSRAGAIGLMQLMPETARRYGVQDPRNPRQNVYGGVRYLRDLLYQFDDVVLALAAYNAGENAVIRYGHQVPPYPETQNYVRKVLDFYRVYRTPS